MPRGFLKHNKAAGAKRGLGGSSKQTGRRPSDRVEHGNRFAKSKVLANRWFNVEMEQVEEWTRMSDTPDSYYYQDDDNHVQCSSDDRVGEITTSMVGTCAICLDVKPLVRLFHKCRHSLSCRNCLKELYSHHSLPDVTLYPLECFHPSCDLVLQATQLETCLNVSKDSPKIAKFHRMTELAKAYRHQEGYQTIHCPDCDFPRLVKAQETFEPPGFGLCVYTCRSCAQSFGWRLGRPEQMLQGKAALRRERNVIARELREHERMAAIQRVREAVRAQHQSTIDALALLAGDQAGGNDGWTICPRKGCRMIISKGNGCNHMVCVCGHHFDWSEAGGRLS